MPRRIDLPGTKLVRYVLRFQLRREKGISPGHKTGFVASVHERVDKTESCNACVADSVNNKRRRLASCDLVNGNNGRHRPHEEKYQGISHHLISNLDKALVYGQFLDIEHSLQSSTFRTDASWS